MRDAHIITKPECAASLPRSSGSPHPLGECAGPRMRQRWKAHRSPMQRAMTIRTIGLPAANVTGDDPGQFKMLLLAVDTIPIVSRALVTRLESYPTDSATAIKHKKLFAEPPAKWYAAPSLATSCDRPFGGERETSKRGLSNEASIHDRGPCGSICLPGALPFSSFQPLLHAWATRGESFDSGRPQSYG